MLCTQCEDGAGVGAGAGIDMYHVIRIRRSSSSSFLFNYVCGYSWNYTSIGNFWFVIGETYCMLWYHWWAIYILGNPEDDTLLEHFWLISLYVTDDAIAKLYGT